MSLRLMGIAAAAVLIGLGAFLTLFGLGSLDGGATSRPWAMVGPILAGFGVALVIVTVKPSR